MNADAFRQFYEYHFTENHKIWDTCIMSLSQEQFTQPSSYSVGSVRNQLVHMMNCDDYWFSALRGILDREDLNPDDFNDRSTLRAHWDTVEQSMRGYLAKLKDEDLFVKPFPGTGDDKLILWQVLLQVGNHGTDHRAQLLRLLSDLGVETGPQDYIFYVFEKV
jgi:uncharacterized damage-inducible protein DinB